MSIARNVSTVGSATLASRALALVRDMGVAAVLGAGPLADAYFAAIQIPNLFRRLSAEGAVNGALVPIWLRLRRAGGERPVVFVEDVLGITLAALTAFALLIIIIAPLAISVIAPGFGGERFSEAVDLLRLSIFYVVMGGAVAIASALLNAEGHIRAAAASVVVFNCVLVSAVLIVLALGLAQSSHAAQILATSFVAAGFAQAILVGIALWRLPQGPRHLGLRRSPDARAFFARALPALTASGVPQLTLIAGTIVASSSTAAVSWLYYAYRLYELPLGVISAAIASVMAPRIAAGVHEGVPTAAQKAQAQALELALGLALPAAAGLAILCEPIIGLLFERGAFTASDTLAVASALAVLAIGLPGHALEKVLGAIAFAHEDATTPMRAALAGLAMAAIAALTLAQAFGHIGIAAGIAAAGWVSSGWLAHALRRQGRLAFAPGTLARAVRIVAATVIMAAALVLLELMMLTFGPPLSEPARIVALVALIGAGMAIYAVSLDRLGIIRARDLLAWIA
ncbi:MAG TPA: murein biosynthesis integral membrane protein MurJ [Xanthobacteraceae bacterium]|nr:murein biosynthesis integral membrane protein MurJ [Xanthobacteraceae bacterium]